MKNWNTKLETFKSEVLGEVNIKRGIYQGDSMSALLFVMALIPLTIMLRRVKSSYHMKADVKINHLLSMDHLKVYAETALNWNHW